MKLLKPWKLKRTVTLYCHPPKEHSRITDQRKSKLNNKSPPPVEFTCR